MTLEVRQMVLKAVVDDDDGDERSAKGGRRASGCGGGGGDDCDEGEQMKSEILAECRRWLLAHLQQRRER